MLGMLGAVQKLQGAGEVQVCDFFYFFLGFRVSKPCNLEKNASMLGAVTKLRGAREVRVREFPTFTPSHVHHVTLCCAQAEAVVSALLERWP